MEQSDAIITIYPDNRIVIGRNYNIGQLLDAIEFARKAVLSIVPRPEIPVIPNE